MKRQTTLLATLGLTAAMAFPVLGDEPATQPDQERDPNVQVDVGKEGAKINVRANDPANRTKLGAYRSGDLLGLDIRNAENENIGTLNDIVVGLDKGEVRYAAISSGGFLGLGDKMRAVPWEHLTMHRATDDTEAHFSLNISTQKFEKAPGFDQDNWPKFADPEFTSAVDKYYQNERNQVEADPNRTSISAARAQTYQLSEFVDLPVVNSESKQIATINDVVVDIDEGKVRYAAVSFDDSWGYGDKMFAIPFEAMKVTSADDAVAVQLNVTQAQMKSATGFDDEHWPDFADPQWRKSTDSFYLKTGRLEIEVN